MSFISASIEDAECQVYRLGGAIRSWCGYFKLDSQEGTFIYIKTSIMELGPPNYIRDGLLGHNSRMVVYMDPLGKRRLELEAD